METESSKDYRNWLFEEWLHRKKHDPLYSMKAFARELGITPSALSQCFAKKRELAPVHLRKIARKLSLTPHQERALYHEAKVRADEMPSQVKEPELFEESELSLASEWYLLALYHLAAVPSIAADPVTLGARLGIPALVARRALRQLEAAGWVEIRAGKLRRTRRPLQLAKQVPPETLRRFHEQILHKACETLGQPDPRPREIATVTLAVDTSRLEEAKRRIREFRKELSQMLESDHPDAVYTFAVELFALDQPPAASTKRSAS